MSDNTEENNKPTDDGLQPYFLSRIELTDYVVARGQVYKVETNDYTGDHYFVEVDEVPEEYWSRWEDDHDA